MRRELKVIPNADLTGHNSLRFPSHAEELVILDDARDTQTAFAYDGPISILGEGSNSILMPAIPGRVVQLALRGIQVEKHQDGAYLINAAAGENWHEVVRYTLGQGISGLENLALIPGSVGAAPYQNIGAYGVELSERLVFVNVYDRRLDSIIELDNDACKFSYRDSLFRQDRTGRYVILSVALRLGTSRLHTEYPDVKQRVDIRPEKSLSAVRIAERVISIRRGKLPDLRAYPNVGSVFKNPVVRSDQAKELEKLGVPCFKSTNGIKVSAAYLIDSLGWKGRYCAGIRVWPKQPLVFVHESGSANANDFLNLAERIRADVSSHYNVALELEPVVVGHTTKQVPSLVHA